MKKNKNKIILLATLVIIINIIFSNLASADCSSGSCVSACASGYTSTGESCTYTAADMSMTGVCCKADTTTTTSSSGSYKNQEKIPGAEPTSNFIQYLKDIIGFGFAIIGILALFMLIIGAYQYLMAAGTGNVSSAKETISSALLGLLLGLCAWIILNKINPDLVNFKSITVSWTDVTTGTGGGTTTGGGNTTPSQNTGKCVEGTGKCAESNLSCFGSDAKNASIVCNAESGGEIKVGGDKCSGTFVSYGLFQVNLTCHDIGMGCTKAFNGCLGTNVTNSSCKVLDDSLYQQCKAAMSDENKNIAYACKLYNSAKSGKNKWGPWSGASKCGISTT